MIGQTTVVADPELKLISEYVNNDIFGKSVSFKDGEGGTGITYKGQLNPFNPMSEEVRKAFHFKR